jgi:hypothetical protein
MRLLAALVVLAASTASVGGSFSAFSSSVSSSATLGANVTFNPLPLTAPVAAGTVAANQTLSVPTPGTWRSNVAITRSYQWQVCTSTVVSTCLDIALATGTTYPLGATPVGAFFRVVETATNSFGAASSASGILP